MKKETFAETSNQKTPSTTKANNPEQDEAYYVNIDGEDIKVDVKNDSEYSCLLIVLKITIFTEMAARTILKK